MAFYNQAIEILVYVQPAEMSCCLREYKSIRFK